MLLAQVMDQADAVDAGQVVVDEGEPDVVVLGEVLERGLAAFKFDHLHAHALEDFRGQLAQGDVVVDQTAARQARRDESPRRRGGCACNQRISI